MHFWPWARAAIQTGLSVVLGIALQAHARPGQTPQTPGVATVELRRTTDNIPHIRASDWKGVGFGLGYAQAQDALCTLAEAFVTFQGRRSFYFGADQRPTMNSTFGRATSLELDLFFRAFADDDVVRAFQREQPPELNELAAGYAAGYNRYLVDSSPRAGQRASHGCRSEAWVQAIATSDIHRRMYVAGLAAGYARFIPEIVNAQPRAVPVPAPSQTSLRSRLEPRVGDSAGLGSNMIAFGRQATAEEGGVLFGNPHWYWGGPDRFYQAHLTIPGKLDVAGAAFLGVPVIMIGFNDHVAWSHTVSEARRFGIFELALDPTDPTRYRVDGIAEAMQARTVTVEVRNAQGGIEPVSRTLYRSRFGPVIDLGRYSPAFGWSAQRALAIRDVNAENLRVFRSFFFWNRAASLDEFIRIQRREAAVPWVNTAAIGRGDGRAWYADVGAVPNVPDELRSACSTPLAEAFAAMDKLTPWLDGSRAACNWAIDPAAVQPGAMAPSRMPSVLRDDYVANMNDSYWLSNPAQPLEGYAGLLGGERRSLSLRGRQGHLIASRLVQSKPASASVLSQRVMHEALGSRAYSADQFKDALLAQACASGTVEVPVEPMNGAAVTVRRVDVREACGVLRQWPNRALAADRGAVLWDMFWARLEKIPVAEFYLVPFSANEPLSTPRSPKAQDPRVARALAEAVVDMSAKGWALNEALGSQRYVGSHTHPTPLFGGCQDPGYFTVACNSDGSYPMGPGSHANSYLQVVRFGARGVEAHTLLAHGLTDQSVSADPHRGVTDPAVQRYARRDWLRFPFREEDIARDLLLKRQLLVP
jgi:acyl-homoserine-lactone acylase